MEIWDIYDADCHKTGQTIVRGEAFREGAYHFEMRKSYGCHWYEG